MESAYKQRLIGAAVLVAAAIIILPMLIGRSDERTAMPSSTVPLDIPQAPDRRFETRELSPAMPVPVPNMAPAPDANTVTTVDVVDSAPASVNVDGNTGFDLSSRPAATPTATATPPMPAPVKPAAPLPQAPASTPAPPPVAVSTSARYDSGFAVNLGSYANAANASALVAQLKARDLPAYVEAVSLDGKPAQRVRLGPFAQRGQAESARLTISQIRKDIPAGVVALDGEPLAKVASPTQPATAAPQAIKPAVASVLRCSWARSNPRKTPTSCATAPAMPGFPPMWNVSPPRRACCGVCGWGRKYSALLRKKRGMTSR